MEAGPLSPDHGKCGTHQIYLLTCEQYEGLLEATGRRCEICGFPAGQMPQKRLYIDHARRVGDWAVRGLLCIRCNTVIGIDLEVPRNEAIATYLNRPWYVRMLAERGIGPELLPEPALGSVATPTACWGLPRKRTAVPRTRTARGWETDLRWLNDVKQWHDLIRDWGPHRISIKQP
jgi:hypothetical protein